MAPAMPHWVPAIVSLIKRIFWFVAYLLQPSNVRETNEPIQLHRGLQQKQHVTPGSKKKGKKQRYREKNLREKAEATAGESQSKTKELELQPAELKLKQQEELVPQQETKSRPCEEPMEKNLRSELEEKIKENGRLQETVAALKDKSARQSKDHEGELARQSKVHEGELARQSKVHEGELARQSKVHEEQLAHLRGKLASFEQLQPVGEDDQTGVPVNHVSNPVAREGEQPRFQCGTPVKTNEKWFGALTKEKNSEDEDKSVEAGLKMPYQPFSRRNSFTSEASLPLDYLSGAVAEGRQPPSDAKDATITTQIDKEINKKPTDIDGIFLSNRDLELRQLHSDANSAQITKQFDEEIEPHLQLYDATLRGGLLSKSKFPLSILLRALWSIRLEKPDVVNGEWLERHCLSRFKSESEMKWLKENLEPLKAEERLNILEKAATAWNRKVGPQLVLLCKKNSRTNHQVHPTLDFDKVLLDSKEGAYKSDGEDIGEVVQLVVVMLKEKTSK